MIARHFSWQKHKKILELTDVEHAFSCANSDSANAFIQTSGDQNRIEQTSDQSNNNCMELSSCNNNDNIATQIGGSSGSRIAQTSDQTNLCLSDSSCANTGSLSANVVDEKNRHLDQELDQINLCLKGSSCSNTGSIIDTGGSNSQSNTCIDGSNCNNSGTNNKTLLHKGFRV